MAAVTKSEQNFALQILNIFDTFRYKGKGYLEYLSHIKSRDEFRIRQGITIPLLTILGYDPQKDIDPEVPVPSGQVDLLVRNNLHRPLIIIETKASLLTDLIPERPQLHSYIDDLNAPLAILTNGRTMEIFTVKGKVKNLSLSINFVDIYRRFSIGGIEALTEKDWDKFIKLKFLSKDFQAIDEEKLYIIPENDISEDVHFSALLEALQRIMELTKAEVMDQFDILSEQVREYKEMIASGAKFYPREQRKYENALKFDKAYQEWQRISTTNSKGKEFFCIETMYILFNRILLIRICEDKGIIHRQISNGGIKRWREWKGFSQFSKINYAELLNSTYKMMNEVYPHLFHQDIFDWYTPSSEVILRILFIFNYYNFANVDRDILGKLYEKYLDREERKRLGQFYTPEEVVDYILDSVDYKVDREIEGKLLLDPACGSGGFLVRAMNRLVDRYRRKGLSADSILDRVRDCIYGFDINPFAAHIAEMNLLFSIIDLISEARRRDPDFKIERLNIFVTNSLKSPINSNNQLYLLGDITSEFLEDALIVRDIKLRRGKFQEGFDFVVGNPPYGASFTAREKQEFKSIFRTPEGEVDKYGLFIEQGLNFLKDNGYLGYIVPNTFLTNIFFTKLRQLLLEETRILEIADLLNLKIFKDATVSNVILIINKEEDEDSRAKNKVRIKEIISTEKEELNLNLKHLCSQKQWISNKSYSFNIYLDDRKLDLIQKIRSSAIPLERITDTVFGVKVYQVGKGNPLQSKECFDNKVFNSTYQKDATFRPFLGGKDVGRYLIDWKGNWVSYGKWLAEPRQPKYFTSPRLVIRQITSSSQNCIYATFTSEDFVVSNAAAVILPSDPDFDIKFLLAIINSPLISFYFLNTSSNAQKIAFPKLNSKDIRSFPIRSTSAENQVEFKALVNEILEINNNIQRIETLADNIPAIISSESIPTSSLADVPQIRFEVPNKIRKPRIRVKPEQDKFKIYLDSKQYIECGNQPLANYLEIYLRALGEDLRGKDLDKLIKLIEIPRTPELIQKVLDIRKALLEDLERLRSRRDAIDKKIDDKVYELYGITQEEKKLIEGK